MCHLAVHDRRVRPRLERPVARGDHSGRLHSLPPGNRDSIQYGVRGSAVEVSSSKWLVSPWGARQMPAPTIFDRPQAPDPHCPHCHASGWKILNELRCECTFRSRPLVEAKAPTLAELEAEYAHTGPDLSKHAWAKTPAEQELAVLKAMQPPMTKQQLQADVIEIEINPRYRGPRESEGVHKETPAGSVPFLVQ